MDDQAKAKGLMAAGLFVLLVIALVVVMVVVPAIRNDGGSHVAVAQAPGGAMQPGMGAPGMGGPMGPGMGGGGAMAPSPGMGGAAGAPGAPGAPAGGAAPAQAVEPLEESRENPFAPAAGQGLVSSGLPPGLAFRPRQREFPVGIFDQHDFPRVGPGGETIQVPSPAPSTRVGGPAAPQPEDPVKVSGILTDPQGRAMVILQGADGGRGAVLQVGDRWKGWKVESITRRYMILSREEDGQVRRRTVPLQTGGQRPGARGGAATGGGAAGATPGARQPGMRRPGGRGAFPGVQGGNQNTGRRTRPRPQ